MFMNITSETLQSTISLMNAYKIETIYKIGVALVTEYRLAQL